jgi:hypothetical protein
MKKEGKTAQLETRMEGGVRGDIESRREKVGQM